MLRRVFQACQASAAEQNEPTKAEPRHRNTSETKITRAGQKRGQRKRTRHHKQTPRRPRSKPCLPAFLPLSASVVSCSNHRGSGQGDHGANGRRHETEAITLTGPSDFHRDVSCLLVNASAFGDTYNPNALEPVKLQNINYYDDMNMPRKPGRSRAFRRQVGEASDLKPAQRFFSTRCCVRPALRLIGGVAADLHRGIQSADARTAEHQTDAPTTVLEKQRREESFAVASDIATQLHAEFSCLHSLRCPCPVTESRQA